MGTVRNRVPPTKERKTRFFQVFPDGLALLEILLQKLDAVQDPIGELVLLQAVEYVPAVAPTTAPFFKPPAAQK